MTVLFNARCAVGAPEDSIIVDSAEVDNCLRIEVNDTNPIGEGIAMIVLSQEDEERLLIALQRRTLAKAATRRSELEKARDEAHAASRAANDRFETASMALARFETLTRTITQLA